MSLILNLQDIHLSFGGAPLLDGAAFKLSAGERLALVGRNGSGKSTLLKIAAGLVEPQSGSVWIQPGTTLRYLAQEPSFAGFDRAADYVAAGLGPLDDLHQGIMLLNSMGLSGEENPAHLSGGEARRLALARAMAPNPDILMLDEPTNHLDLGAIEWLEAQLSSLRSSLILISHDRRLLEDLTNATVWLDRGQARQRNVGFKGFEAWRDEVLDQEERERELLNQRIASEEHWMRYGVTARRKRNVRRVELLGNLRKERRDHIGQQGQVKFSGGGGDLSGRLVIEAKQLTKSFGDQIIVNGLDLLLLRGDRLALVGPNGAGKTTLINLLTGVLQVDSGSVRLGANVNTVTIDQKRDSIEPTDLLADVITGGRGSTVTIGHETRHVVSYMKDFLFRPEQARTPVSVLSGGERARLLLAREFAKPSNLLILDEPTNDLDLDTLDLLEEWLADYKGSVILVSHDRDFIDRIATSVLLAEGDGQWVEYAGGYSDMVRQRRAAAPTVKPASAPSPRGSSKTETPKSGPKRKLSFKEQHALTHLPKQMGNLQKELVELETVMADANLFKRDAAAFTKATERYGLAKAELALAEDQWLELELLREELASG